MGLSLSALCALWPAAASATVADTFYERAVMTAADERCRLFAPDISSALAAGRAQARGAALRAGYSPEALSELERRARTKAWSSPCNSADILTAAGRVRGAFAPYSRQSREIYRGDLADWTATRLPVARTPSWQLSQPQAFGSDRLVFGLAGQDGRTALLAVAHFSDGAEPYTARILLRDPALARQPYLDRRRADARGRLPLSARMPPRSSSRAFIAQAREPADPRLAPGEAKSAIAFRFSQQAVTALAGLDPREAIAVEFVFGGRSGETVRRAYVEVGDFSAGQAFLQLGQR